MKTIGIDGRLYFQTGVGVYLRNLLNELAKMGGSQRYYVYVMQQDCRKIQLSQNFIIRPVNACWHSVAEQTVFCQTLYRDKLDLMHFTYFSYPVCYRRPFIATIHDITPLSLRTGKASTRHPLVYWGKYHVYRFVLREQIMNAKRIITPTETIKQQIAQLYGQAVGNKIYPIYEGVNHELLSNNGSSSADFLSITQPFYIYVGNFYPHKNVEKLIAAYSKVQTDAKLILIGPRDYFALSLLDLIDKLGQNKRIILYDKVTMSGLIFCYQKAKGLIHPSLSEGFGLPIVEAMHFHLPILASNIAVFRELLGDQYLAFDPNSLQDMICKIQMFVDKKSSKIQYHQMERFSFPAMAKATYRLYHDTMMSISR